MYIAHIHCLVKINSGNAEETHVLSNKLNSILILHPTLNHSKGHKDRSSVRRVEHCQRMQYTSLTQNSSKLQIKQRLFCLTSQ